MVDTETEQPSFSFVQGDFEEPPIVPDPSASEEEPTTARERYKRWRSSNPIDRNAKAPAPRTPPMPRPGVLARQLEEFYTAIGMLLMPFDQVCANAVIASAPECSQKLEKLCKQNHTVRRLVMKWLETSVTAEVVMAHAPIIMAVMMHHAPGAMKAFGRGFEEAEQEQAEQAS